METEDILAVESLDSEDESKVALMYMHLLLDEGNDISRKRFDQESVYEDECLSQFRLKKEDLIILRNIMDMPAT